MIKYIQHKQVNFERIQGILKESQQLNQFTNRGPAKFSLELELAKLMKIDEDKKVIVVANGTLALHTLMLFYEKKNGKILKWATPSFTFPSSVVGKFKANVEDIDLNTYTMSLTDNLINKYDGFIITNLFGTYPSNIYDWVKKCKEQNKILIFDNASSPMTQIENKNINNFGDCTFGSLHHTKYLGFGEGGFIVANKEDYEELNSIVGFGFTGTSIKRKYSKYSSNFKMSDTTAAFILQHIEQYNMDSHKQIQSFFIEELKNLKNIKLFNYNDGVIYGNLPLIYDKKINHLFFKDQGVEAHKYYYPLKRQKNSMVLYNNIVNLPLHAGLTDYEVQLILSLIKKSIR